MIMCFFPIHKALLSYFPSNKLLYVTFVTKSNERWESGVEGEGLGVRCKSSIDKALDFYS